MNKKNLLILGAGQYGHVVKETAQAMGCFDVIAFLDDHSEIAVGKLKEFEKLTDFYHCAFVAIGNTKLRMQWLDRLRIAGYEIPVLIHPRAYVAPSAVMGEGSIAEPMAVVNTEVEIGIGNLICAGAVVNHNSIVRHGCQIDCNAVVVAGAVVPDGTKVPSGTVYERE